MHTQTLFGVRRGVVSVVLCLVVAPTTASAEPCRPTVVLRGDAQLAADVGRLLHERGVVEDAVSGCPTARADLVRSGSEISIDFSDPWGGNIERRVALADTAAALIESWVRSDMTAALLETEREVQPPVLQEPSQESPERDAPRMQEARITAGSATGAVGAEGSFGADGSIWAGVAASGCVRLGPVCAGALARAATDTQAGGESQRLDTRRTEGEVLLQGGLPLRAGQLTVTSGFALGVGWMRITRIAPTTEGEQGVDIDAGGLRLGAFSVASLSMSRRLLLDLSFALDVAPLAHTDPFEDDGLVLAGEPRGQLRLGLGLRYGEP